MSWPNLTNFERREFRRPEIMQEDFLLALDELRNRCGFPLVITSDGRTEEDMNRIYRGVPENKRPNSPHKRGRAVDVQPVPNTPEKRIILLHHITGMYMDGTLPRLGLEVADRHIHFDNDDVLTRPWLWVGKSR
jgi:hypothetical protein